MYWIEGIKEIFAKFSLYETALSVVHINGDKSKASFPFVIKPAASNKCLCCLFKTEHIYNQKENVSSPSIVGIEVIAYKKKSCKAEKLKFLIRVKVFDYTKGEISEKQCKKHILFRVG